MPQLCLFTYTQGRSGFFNGHNKLLRATTSCYGYQKHIILPSHYPHCLLYLYFAHMCLCVILTGDCIYPHDQNCIQLPQSYHKDLHLYTVEKIKIFTMYSNVPSSIVTSDIWHHYVSTDTAIPINLKKNANFTF